MAKVLTDLFSLYSFGEIIENKFKDKQLGHYKNHFSLIENLILCEQIIVEKNGVSHFGIESMCNSFPEAFGYITDERLYKDNGVGDTPKTIVDLDERGLIYADVAREHEIYFSPHPYREKSLSDKIEKYINSTATNVIDHVDQRIRESNTGKLANINIIIPPIVEHSLYFSKSQGITIADSINEIRNSKNAQLFRLYISEFDAELKNLSPRKKITAYQPLFRDIDKLCNLWVQDMNEEVKFHRRKINLSKIPIIGSLFEALGVRELEIKDPIIFPSKPHLLFINDIYQK